MNWKSNPMNDQLKTIQLSNIIPNPDQPRTTFDQEKLQELADSIVENGLINPITVEETPDPDIFILEDGERRWRAHKLAGLETIQAIVKPSKDSRTADRLTAALVANLHREDVNAIDEARAYQKLYEVFGKHTRVARKVGVNSSRVKHRLSLLQLDLPIQDLIAAGKLQKDARAVNAFLSIPDTEARIKLAKRMASPGVTVSIIEATTRKLLARLEGTKLPPKDEIPSVYHAQRKKGFRDAPIYDQLARRNKLPHWELVKNAANKACQACAFYDAPTQEICYECPAVHIISELIVVSLKEEK
jgi:ParB/RepB/Spo0J family partition protein